MPPKPQPGKKGAVDQEDFSDVPTLPPLNSYLFTLLFRNFFSQETREKVQKAVTEKIPQDRIKTLTRDDIIAYGKLKQIILEPNQQAALPPEDPRAKMSEIDQLAKAANDKLFEMSVHARRAKKERIQKLEEEAKLQQVQDIQAHINQIQDNDQLDVMFNLIDYPLTKNEAIAFAKHNQTLNCIFDINQKLKQPDNVIDYQDHQELYDNQEQDSQQEITHQQKVQSRINELLQARETSVKGSSLRNMAVVAIDFFNCPQINFRVNEQGEEVEERKESEAIFAQEFISQKLEHYGALAVKYQRFRDRVQMIPLVPDKETMQMIQDIKQEAQEQYYNWLEQQEQVQQQYEQSQSNLDQTQQEQLRQEKEQWKADFEREKQERLALLEDGKKRIAELSQKLKESVEEQKDYSQLLKMDQYKSSYIKSNKECQNSVASLMSAMVNQLSNGDATLNTTYYNQADATTEPESIDDLFSDFFDDVNNTLLDQRRYDNNQNNQGYVEDDANKPRRKGTEAYSRQVTVVGEVEYNEEQDASKRALQKLPKNNLLISDQDKAEVICLREKEALSNLVLPGFDRHLMPPVPSKSERLRDAERPGIYPFCTLPVEEAERAMILNSFQELMKSNFIDEGKPSNLKHSKFKAFERNYESFMQPEILRQVLAKAFLQEPDMATLYYPRDDSLLLALYNKQKPQAEEPQYGLDGERQWKAAYRVMPDFENWIKYFSEELVIPINSQSTANLNQQQQNQIPKYQMDDEMVPDQLLDIDDQKIQNLQETSKMLYPTDGSIMKVDSYTVGGQTYTKSQVVKDNLTFGLRQSTNNQDETPEDEKEFGLVSYKRTRNLEFWLNFENDTKMLVETVQKQRNPQRMIRIDPPKPTPEEIAAREEAIKQAQLAAAKQNRGKQNSALSNQPVIEEYKPPEPTWEPEPFDYLDTLFDNEQWEQKLYQSTTTLPNGLIVQHMSDGNVVQMNIDQLLDKTIEEKDRVFMRASGVVVRHLRNRDAEVLFPNGIQAYFTKKDMMWVVTNNKGLRTAMKNGIKWDLEPIPCATETDAVTNATMMIREDNVMTIEFADGSLYCQHQDGTMMKSTAGYGEIRIEKDGFSPVVIKKIEDQNACKKDSAGNRALDNIVMETHLPDGTVVESFMDNLQLEIADSDVVGFRHLYNRPDFSVVSVNSLGAVTVITSNARSALNEYSGKALMGQDTQYTDMLYDRNEVYNTRGFYHCYLENPNNEPQLFTCDVTGRIKYRITQQLDLQKVNNDNFQQSLRPNEFNQPNMVDDLQMTDDGRELEETGGYKYPFTQHYVYPRLFVIKADGSGYELLSEQQLDYYFRINKHSMESLKQRNVVMIGNSSAKSHYFVTKVQSLEDKQIQNTYLKSLDFPQNAIYALYHKKNQPIQTNGLQVKILPQQYQFRQIFEFQEFEPFKQDAFYDDCNRYRQWKMSQVRYDNEFGIVHVPAKDQQLDYKKIEDDEYFARRIITKILKERREKRNEFNPEDFKKKFVDLLTQNKEVKELQSRLSSYNNTMKQITENTQDNNSTKEREKLTQHQILLDNQNAEKIKNIKKKQQVYVENSLQDIRRMLNTPTFIPNYFQSKPGQTFVKNNPEKPPSQEMIMRMSQRINRSQHNTDKNGSSQIGDEKSHRSNNRQPDQQNIDDRESPIVHLEPEDQYKQGSAFLGQGTKQRNDSQGPQASLYLQEKMYVRQRDQEQQLKSEEYHVVKTKDFNVYGRLRQEKPFVKTIQKSNAQPELNEKFITTECIADRRVKISSMASRQYINAPSIEDVRKQGQHQMILSAINKKQTFADLINQANSMVTSVLHDPLKRCVNIMPHQVKFGTLCVGQVYELILTVKNEDQLAQRIQIKPISDRRIKVQQLDTGAIAPGIVRKISITVSSEEECQIKETLQISCKTDIFKIPIEANILSVESYQKEQQEAQVLNGKTLMNSRVRNKLNESIQKGRQGSRGNSNERDEDNGPNTRIPWIETTNSESKLPHIPNNMDKRTFDVDPKKNLKDILKK